MAKRRQTAERAARKRKAARRAKAAAREQEQSPTDAKPKRTSKTPAKA